jgi:hypothetical protein
MTTLVGYRNGSNRFWDAQDFAGFISDFIEDGIDNFNGDYSDLGVHPKSPAALAVQVSGGRAYMGVTVSGQSYVERLQLLSTEEKTITANATGDNRIDAVIARIDVDVAPNSAASNMGTIEVITGTGTSPLSDSYIQSQIGDDSFLRLADITVPNGASSISESAIQDQRVRSKLKINNSFIESLNWKKSCRVATVSGHSLSSIVSGFTIDGVTIAENDRVLVKNQVDASENGIYNVKKNVDPVRAADFDETEDATMAVVGIEEGTSNAEELFLCTSLNPVIDTDNIVFEGLRISISKASQAEADAGIEDDKYMTPLKTRQSLGIGANGTIPFADNSQTKEQEWRLPYLLGNMGRSDNWFTYPLSSGAWAVGLGTGSALTMGWATTLDSVSPKNAIGNFAAGASGLLPDEYATYDKVVVEFFFRYNNNSADVDFHFGLCQNRQPLEENYNANSAGDEFAGVSIDGSTNKLYAKNYDGSTMTLTEIKDVVEDTLYRCRLELSASSFKVYIDGVLEDTSTTNLPTINNVMRYVGCGEKEVSAVATDHNCLINSVVVAAQKT